MELQFRCPSCDKLLQVPAKLAGKKVRCTKCDKVTTAPAEDSRPTAPSNAVTTRPTASKRPPASDPDDYDDERDDERRSSRSSDRSNFGRDKRRKLERGKSSTGLWIGIGAGSVGIVVVTIGVIIALTRSAAPPAAPPPVALFRGQPVEQGFFIAEGQKGVPAIPPQQGIPVVVPQEQGPGPVVLLGPPPAQIDAASVQRVKQSTVYLRVTTANGQVGEGTGFLALEPGLVLTNAHVVGMRTPSAALPRNVQVVIHSGEFGEKSFSGTVLGAESGLDLAVVRIEAGGAALPPPLPLDSALRLRELQEVYIFGFPFGAQLGKNITVSKSSVSSLRKAPGGVIAQIQVNGGMHPGNSGGPVVDSRGVVVGIAVAVIRGTQINFAVPADHVMTLVHGFVRNTEIGAAYRAGDTVKLPVRVVCTDPLHRIRDLHLEVWSGQDGAIRPASILVPPSQPGDGPKQNLPLTYRNGSALVEIDLPETPLGGAVWLQPILTSQNGIKIWSAAIPIHAGDEPPLERVPATFQLSNAKQPERTLTLEGTRQIKLIKGQEYWMFGERIEVTMLEHLQPEPRGVSVHLHPGALRVKREVQGQGIWASSPGALLVERLLFSFLMDADGKLKERGQPGQLQALQPPLKQDAEAVFNNVATCYEATCLTVPLKKVEPLATWKARVPLLLVTDGKNEVADMDLVCTYEGIRKQLDSELAYVRLEGEVRGRGAKEDAVGKVSGHFLFDLRSGFSVRAKIVVDSEIGTGAVVAHNILEIQLTRQAGNALNIAKIDPKAKLPTTLAEMKQAPVAAIAKGKTLLNVTEALTSTDPIDKRKPGGRFKEYKIKLTAGVKYVIEMNTTDPKQLDPYLRIETAQGAVLAFDDDGGGDLNARIVYTPERSAEYHIIATVFDPNQSGPFTLIVSEVAKTGKK